MCVYYLVTSNAATREKNGVADSITKSCKRSGVYIYFLFKKRISENEYIHNTYIQTYRCIAHI